jgi:Flp pilus assembly pilin Flp
VPEGWFDYLFDKTTFVEQITSAVGQPRQALEDSLRTNAFKRFLQDDRGALFTEYVAVTTFVGLVTLPALLYCGWQLAGSFAFVRNYVLYPFP